MSSGASGGCRCGACRYTVALTAPPKIYACHCRHCQTWSGSAFTEQALVMAEAITADGPVADFAMTRGDGAISTHYVCGLCHTRLWNSNSKWPTLAVIRAGTLHESDALSPLMHIWIVRKQPWVILDPVIPAFPESAPASDLVKLINR